MKNGGRIIEVRDRSGGLILSFLIAEKPVQETPKETKNNQSGSKGNENPLAQDAFMTDAQKRYLFRILADQGKEGEEAHEHLKKLFQVDSLKEVTKLEASQAIERLLAESKGGAGK
jgi:formate dehydrogenase maturation protein FdhE